MLEIHVLIISMRDFVAHQPMVNRLQMLFLWTLNSHRNQVKLGISFMNLGSFILMHSHDKHLAQDAWESSSTRPNFGDWPARSTV